MRPGVSVLWFVFEAGVLQVDSAITQIKSLPFAEEIGFYEIQAHVVLGCLGIHDLEERLSGLDIRRALESQVDRMVSRDLRALDHFYVLVLAEDILQADSFRIRDDREPDFGYFLHILPDLHVEHVGSGSLARQEEVGIHYRVRLRIHIIDDGGLEILPGS